MKKQIKDDKVKDDMIYGISEARNFYIRLWREEQRKNRLLWILIGILGIIIALLFTD